MQEGRCSESDLKILFVICRPPRIGGIKCRVNRTFTRTPCMCPGGELEMIGGVMITVAPVSTAQAFFLCPSHPSENETESRSNRYQVPTVHQA